MRDSTSRNQQAKNAKISVCAEKSLSNNSSTVNLRDVNSVNAQWKAQLNKNIYADQYNTNSVSANPNVRNQNVKLEKINLGAGKLN